MNRNEYMSAMAGKERDELAAIHQAYYLGLAKAGHLTLPTSWIPRVLASKCEHFNDIPLAEWDFLAVMAKGAIGRANKVINGQSVWSYSDGVCIFKALARQTVEYAKTLK